MWKLTLGRWEKTVLLSSGLDASFFWGCMMVENIACLGRDYWTLALGGREH